MVPKNSPTRYAPRPVPVYRILGIALCLGSGIANSLLAREISKPDICRHAAERAAAKTGIPVDILHAISLTETGRKIGANFDPWPWTINMEGKGVWFDDRKSVTDYANKNFKRGARSFDLGCFQINYKWHSKAFTSIEQMLDPDANANYAARYLLELFSEKGNWESAVGAYHSRTPKFANKYKKRFARIYTGLSGQPALPETAKIAYSAKPGGPRLNAYPLLQSQPKAIPTLGSLFSLARQPTNPGLITQSNGPLF